MPRVYLCAGPMVSSPLSLAPGTGTGRRFCGTRCLGRAGLPSALRRAEMSSQGVYSEGDGGGSRECGARKPRVPSVFLFSLLCWCPPHQLAFLLLSLTRVCLQLYRVAKKGVRNYWRKPGNWLEVATPVVSVRKAGTVKSLPGNEPIFSGKLLMSWLIPAVEWSPLSCA